MTTSITEFPAGNFMKEKWPIASGIILALTCFFAPPPVGAADLSRENRQHAQRQVPHHAYRHQNYRHGGYYKGYPGYAYGAPPRD